MADEVYCDICKEHDVLVPATMAFCVQRADDPDATPQYVRCCDEHEGQAAARHLRQPPARYATACTMQYPRHLQ